jgi:hypothetical protein
MSYPAVVRTVFERFVDARSVFCTGCAHSEFVHGEFGTRLCLFSECGCDGWRPPREHDETTRGDTLAS